MSWPLTAKVGKKKYIDTKPKSKAIISSGLRSKNYKGKNEMSGTISYNREFTSFSGTLEYDTGKLYNTYSVDVDKVRVSASISSGIDPIDETFFMNVSFTRQNKVGIYTEHYFEVGIDVKTVAFATVVVVAIIALPELGLAGAAGVSIIDSIRALGDLLPSFS